MTFLEDCGIIIQAQR